MACQSNCFCRKDQILKGVPSITAKFVKESWDDVLELTRRANENLEKAEESARKDGDRLVRATGYWQSHRLRKAGGAVSQWQRRKALQELLVPVEAEVRRCRPSAGTKKQLLDAFVLRQALRHPQGPGVGVAEWRQQRQQVNEGSLSFWKAIAVGRSVSTEGTLLRVGGDGGLQYRHSRTTRVSANDRPSNSKRSGFVALDVAAGRIPARCGTVLGVGREGALPSCKDGNHSRECERLRVQRQEVCGCCR